MNEAMVHKITTAVRSLQAQIMAAINSTIETAESLNEDTRIIVSNVYYSPMITGTRKIVEIYCNKTLNSIRSLFYNHINFGVFRRYYSICTLNFAKWTSTQLYIGCIGLFIGGGIGVLVGINYYSHFQYIVPMKAIVTNNYNGIKGITLIDEVLAPVIISSNEILVHVKAASLDIVDIQISAGYGRVLRRLYQSTVMKRKREFPIILGRDCAGVVIEVGYNVKKFEVGDAVWLALPYWMVGTLAEYIAVKDCYASLKPRILDFERSAAIPYSGCIAWDAVCNKAKLSAISAYSKRVLVHCGNTPVGCMIIQLCSFLGAQITASCCEQAKPLMLELGAKDTLLLDKVSSDSGFENPHNRFDVVFNTFGPSGNDFCNVFCKTDGILINTYSAVPSSDTYGYLRTMLYGIWLKIKKSLCGYNVWKDVPIDNSVLEELSSLVNNGRLRPIIDKVYNCEDYERAFRYIGASKHPLGKSVIRFSDSSAQSARYCENRNYFL